MSSHDQSNWETAHKKYLGIELDPVLSFKEFKQRIREKARKNMSKIWGMGMINGALSVKASITLYDALVRSILEYGAEIWGSDGWEEGEKIHREMGKRILRCHGKTTNEAVLGELGWWRLRTRREFIKLKYWLRILLMKDSNLVKQIYRWSKDEYTENGTKNWCETVHKSLTKYGLISLWNDENLIYKIENENPTQEKVKKYWLKHFYKTIHQVEEKEWLKDMKNKPKLRTYLTFKNKLKLEEYLISEHNKKGRYLLTSLRVGTAKLRIKTGRWKKKSGRKRE
jgi:hypothetical protein